MSQGNTLDITNTSVDKAAALYVSKTMCLELVRHAELAIGDFNPERDELKSKLLDEISTAFTIIPVGRLPEFNEENLLIMLIGIWDTIPYDAVYLQYYNEFLKQQTAKLMMLLAELSHAGLQHEALYAHRRMEAQFLMQCSSMTDAIIQSKGKLPHGSAPDSDFFAAMLPAVCDADIAYPLMVEVMQQCPNVW